MNQYPLAVTFVGLFQVCPFVFYQGSVQCRQGHTASHALHTCLLCCFADYSTTYSIGFFTLKYG
jgi:hypothetical protein